MKWGDREYKVHVPIVYEPIADPGLKKLPPIEEVRRRWRKLLEEIKKDRREHE